MPKIPAINPLLQGWLLEGPLSCTGSGLHRTSAARSVCHPHVGPLPERRGALRALDGDVPPTRADAR